MWKAHHHLLTHTHTRSHAHTLTRNILSYSVYFRRRCVWNLLIKVGSQFAHHFIYLFGIQTEKNNGAKINCRFVSLISGSLDQRDTYAHNHAKTHTHTHAHNTHTQGRAKINRAQNIEGKKTSIMVMYTLKIRPSLLLLVSLLCHTIATTTEPFQSISNGFNMNLLLLLLLSLIQSISRSQTLDVDDRKHFWPATLKPVYRICPFFLSTTRKSISE